MACPGYPVQLHASRAWELVGTPAPTWESLPSLLLGSVEATQFYRGGGLRLPCFSQPYPAAAILAQGRGSASSTDLINGEGPVLDVGCGSSKILGSLPEGSVGLDILSRKLRYSRRFGVPLVHASGFDLPFPDASFSCVLSSQVIEHVPKESPMIDELCRVLKPGGRLVLGTPDYSRREWVYLEKLYERIVPGGYADEHIARYTRTELIEPPRSTRA